jgi:Tfp pilus assembly protein PilF
MRTRTTLKKLTVLCSGALLLACADLSGNSARSLFVPSARTADEAYQQGRQQHLARRYGEALKSYQAALAADKGHVNARNGLATLYAEQRDFAQAIPIWRALTENASMSSGPAIAFLFNNLGYAYFLAADYGNAQAALEKACLLDPLNHRAWQNLGETLQKLGQDERAAQMFRQAAALRKHDFRADYAAAGGGGAVTAIDTAVKATQRPDQEWAAVDVHVAADGMLELKRIPAARPAVSSVAAAQAADALPVPAPPVPQKRPEPLPVPTPAAPRVALLEIRNGNGVTGMAKALSRQMGDPAIKVVRLSNEKGFNVRVTRIEYRPAHREAAERLAARFGNATTLEVNGLAAPDLRLLIGHDIATGKFALRPVARPEPEPELAKITVDGRTG